MKKIFKFTFQQFYIIKEYEIQKFLVVGLLIGFRGTIILNVCYFWCQYSLCKMTLLQITLILFVIAHFVDNKMKIIKSFSL